MYSCYLFLISSASVRSIPFLSFISPIFLKRSLVFPILLFPFLCIDHWGRLSYLSLLFFGTLHSNGYLFPFLLCFSCLFFSQLFLRPTQTTILPFCISFSWGWSWSLLLYGVMNFRPYFFRYSIRSNPLNLFVTSTVYSSGIWLRSYLNGLVVFPTFFNLSLNLAIKSSWSEPQSAPGLVFADYIEFLHLWLQRI